MAEDYVFRFLSVRPADLARQRDRADTKLALYADTPKTEGSLRVALEKIGSSASPEAIRRAVEEYRGGDRYVHDVADLPFDPRPGIGVALEHGTTAADAAAVSQAFKQAYGSSVDRLAKEPKLLDSLLRLADTLLAEIVATGGDAPVDGVTLAHKTLTLIVELGTGATLPAGATVADLVGSRTLVAPKIGKTAPDRVVRQPTPNPEPARPADDQALARRMAELATAHTELRRLATRPSARAPRAIEEPAAERLRALEDRFATLERAQADKVRDLATSGPSAGAPLRPSLSMATIEALAPETKRTLASLKVETEHVDPVATVTLIEHEIAAVGSQIASSKAPAALVDLGGTLIARDQLRTSLGLAGPWQQPNFALNFCELQAGIGDLLMVKQKLKAYELGEFAHVENVLAGETRDREHRRLDTSEDITTTEQTTETQKEKDLQSTQRNEMQSEADKTVKQQFGLEAGLQVSGSYGPTVQFAAHLNANYSTSSEETQRKAISFSQEITEKTSESVRQTIKQTVSHRVLQEIQEINKHSFVNPSTDHHIRGVYRWLDKVYDAQIFNYGQRMMYEFVVPEPAAYFLYAMVENPPKDSDLIKPDPPMYQGQPLDPSNLTPWNYTDYVGQYLVAAVPPPPSTFQTKTYFDKQDGGDNNNFGRAGKIDVPDGYEAYAATVMSDYVYEEGSNHAFHVMLGDADFDRTQYWGSEYRSIDSRRTELSVAYECFHLKSFTLGIDVECQVTDEALAKWRQGVYDSIIQAYLKQKADYEEKLAAKQIQNGPGDLGRNPGENTRIAKEELKKLALMVLIGADDIERDSMLSSAEPWMDLSLVCANGSWIRFFENAFEWTNLVYVFYPYFWGRHARWNSAIHFTDPDSDFAAFLRAGAARLQVPVRPGFEKAVAYFCQYGQIWEGNDPPLRDDDLYVPIVDEIAANLGKFDNDGVPYPDGSTPWEVRVPTELVLVENIDEVPNIRDVLTGSNVTLHA